MVRFWLGLDEDKLEIRLGSCEYKLKLQVRLGYIHVSFTFGIS